MFVGYPLSQKGWLFLDETTKKIFTATHAAIFEAPNFESSEAQAVGDGAACEEDFTDDEEVMGSVAEDPEITDVPAYPTETPPIPGRGSQPIRNTNAPLSTINPSITTQRRGNPSWLMREEAVPNQAQIPRQLQFDGATDRTAITDIGSIRATRSGQNFMAVTASEMDSEQAMCLLVQSHTIKAKMPNLPVTFQHDSNSSDSNEWLAACDSELSSLQTNDTYEVVELPEGRKAIDTRWVFAHKLAKDGSIDRYKARIVAKGFKQLPRY